MIQCVRVEDAFVTGYVANRVRKLVENSCQIIAKPVQYVTIAKEFFLPNYYRFLLLLYV